MQGNINKTTDKGNKCANCHATLPKNALYCDACGTKKGDGKFKPQRNRPRAIYGPPIRITHHCSSCGYIWQKSGMKIKNSSSCPKCGASFVDYSTDRPKPKGTVVGSYFEKNEPVQKISEAEVEKLLDLREKYKEDKQHVLKGHEADNLSKFMIQNGFCEFKKHDERKKLSNYEAERINLVKKIMNSLGYKNAMPSKLTCPKCKGLFACQIKKLEKKEGTNKEIIPRNNKILTILNSRIRATKDISLMCLQCGLVFKKTKKEK
jgi:predicted  nucleic acid-binding Zn-ribbon protein